MIPRFVRAAGAFLLLSASITCDPKETDYFLTEQTLTPFGELTGLVSSGGTPLVGATVALTGADTRSTTTNAGGMYDFLDLAAGNYTATPSATGFNCVAQSILVAAHRSTTLNLLCTPQVGRIDGLIRLDVQPQAGVLVTARQGSNNVGTGTSAANGTYSIPNLPPGTYTTIITPPSNSTCSPTQRDVTVQSNLAATSNFDCTSLPGNITGTVLVNGTGQSGVAVTVSQGGTTVGTATTGTGGTYTVSNLPPGTYSASITPPANTSCTSNPQNVTVQANQASTANFACTSLPGIISGTVFVDMVARAGVSVTLTQNGTTIGTTTTAANGSYSFANLSAGSYSVGITPPANTACPDNPQSATVQANQTPTVNFTCLTLANEFAVTLDNPAPSYRHIIVGVSSETCTGMSTNPAQPGGTWTTMWTGNGTVGVTSRSGVLDAAGKATDRQPINLTGTYNVTASVTAGGTTRSANGSVTVTSAAGSCPPPPP
jgi:hypothetical protein